VGGDFQFAVCVGNPTSLVKRTYANKEELSRLDSGQGEEGETRRRPFTAFKLKGRALVGANGRSPEDGKTCHLGSPRMGKEHGKAKRGLGGPSRKGQNKRKRLLS